MTDKYQIIQGDVIDALRELPSESVHCCVTSPPYWNLRDYGVDGQIGLEPTLDAYVEKMVQVFREVRRVLRSDGTLWLNIGDSYAGGMIGRRDSFTGRKIDGRPVTAKQNGNPTSNLPPEGLKRKDLCMVPARVALALQADGWYLRSEIIWAKRAPMPESVTDRPTSAHEKIYLLSRSERYFYDADAVREKAVHGDPSSPRGSRGAPTPNAGLRKQDALDKQTYTGFNDRYEPLTQRNLRNVWNINTEPYPAAHFATFPTIIPKRAILAGTSERGCCPCCGSPWRREVNRVKAVSKPCPKTQAAHEARGGTGVPVGTVGKSGSGRIDGYTETIGWFPSCRCNDDDDGEELATIPCTVLEPFAGSGTTLAVALSLGRHAIGIELNEEYIKLAHERIAPHAAQELLPL